MAKFEDDENRNLREVGLRQYLGNVFDRLRAMPTTLSIDGTPVIQIGPQGMLISISLTDSVGAKEFAAKKKASEAIDADEMAEIEVDEAREVQAIEGLESEVPDSDGGI